MIEMEIEMEEGIEVEEEETTEESLIPEEGSKMMEVGSKVVEGVEEDVGVVLGMAGKETMGMEEIKVVVVEAEEIEDLWNAISVKDKDTYLRIALMEMAVIKEKAITRTLDLLKWIKCQKMKTIEIDWTILNL